MFLYLLLLHKYEKRLKISLFSIVARINFCEFALAKNFPGINFRDIAQNSLKLLPVKITSFKVLPTNFPPTFIFSPLFTMFVILQRLVQALRCYGTAMLRTIF